jgi:hypothetical protein
MFTRDSLSFAFGWSLFLLLAANAAYFLPLSLNWPLAHDGALQHYSAWRILNGAVPYLDLSDMNMPGTYLLHMLCLEWFGTGDFAFRLFDLFWCALSAIAILAIGGRVSLYAGAGALFFIGFHLQQGPEGMAQRDFLLMPFLLFAAYALKRFLEQPSQTQWMFACGVLVGTAFWIKPVVLVFALFCAIAATAKLRWSYYTVLALGWLALGFLLPAMAVHAWLYELGALPAFYQILLKIILSIHSNLHLIGWEPIRIAFLVLDLAILAVLLLILFCRSQVPPADKTLLAIGLIYGFFHFYGQDKGWSYHAYPLWGFYALYVALVLPRLRFPPAEAAIVYVAALLAACILLPKRTYNAPVAPLAAIAKDGIGQIAGTACREVPRSSWSQRKAGAA